MKKRLLGFVLLMTLTAPPAVADAHSTQPVSLAAGKAIARDYARRAAYSIDADEWSARNCFCAQGGYCQVLEDVPFVVELRDGGPGVMVRRWRA